MRIAYIAVKGIPIGGGIEKLTEEIGVRLVKKGHHVIIYSSRDYGTVDGRYKGMEIRTVLSINTKSMHKMSICLAATLDVLLRRSVDIVHVHAVGPSVFSIFPRVFGIPTVVQTHGLEWKRDKWGFIGRSFLRLAEYSALYFPNRTTCVSKVQQRYFVKRYGKDVVFIPTGVNRVQLRKPNWIRGIGLQKNGYILFAARLVEEKGAHYLIKAFRRLDTDMKLVVAGDAEHAERYRSHLTDLAGDDPRILFPGFITGTALEELFSNAYIFVLPSTLEGLPIALLEAMSYGNCCVASDIPENLEAIEGFGYTFRNRDANDLFKVLKYLIDRPEKVKAAREPSRQHVLANYSWEKITDDMESLYYSLLRR